MIPLSQRVQHPLVRDLAWLVEGHYIERDFALEAYWLPDVTERVLALDQQPSSLAEAMAACKSHFLGSYFEALFSYAIRHLSMLTIHLEHVQIVGQGKTLGEVDMLVETPAGDLHQFEIAIKFYLERQDLYPNHWIGPNKNDSLLKKVTRAREHQLQILQTEEGVSAIADVAKGRVPHSNLLIFGRLYKPLGNGQDGGEWLAQTEFGGWVRESEAATLTAQFSKFIILQKPHWLAFPNDNVNFSFNLAQSAYNLVGKILHNSRPEHVFLWSSSEQEEAINKHVFIVPDLW